MCLDIIDISPKSTLKIICTGNMQALFHSLEKSKLSFNAEHNELHLLNVSTVSLS